jgi:cytolysin (calcineurin-like family phosphatase)
MKRMPQAIPWISCLALAAALWTAGCAYAADRPAAAPPQACDVTFFVVSDTHYGAPAPPPRKEAAAAKDAVIAKDAVKPPNVVDYPAKRAAVDKVNALPETPYPADLGGGAVAVPRGVLVPGDLINDGSLPEAADQLKEWLKDFGVSGEGRLRFPVYEAYGNHDLGPGDLVQNAIRSRNQQRRGLAEVSPSGLHCSWDWDGVHMVNVNLYPGDKPDPATHYAPIHDPKLSLEFLKADLAKHVGKSGRPVIVWHHYDLQGTDWWTEAERDAYYEAIKDYNVIAIIHGHTGTAIYKWKGLDVFNVGNLDASCFVFRITRTQLAVAQRKADGTWGMRLKKPIAGL